jgi:hypothetical protein
MAFFDADSVPRALSRDEFAFVVLASQERLVRFPTGADGGYLLHVFISQPIPEEVKRYCSTEDVVTGFFSTDSGHIAFGGLESTYAEFEPNSSIRSDGSIEPGRYSYTAYRTEFPDELVMQAIRVERNPGERWLGRAPLLGLWCSFRSHSRLLSRVTSSRPAQRCSAATS